MNIGDKYEKLYMNFLYYINVDWGWGKYKLCEFWEKKIFLDVILIKIECIYRFF